MINIRYSAYIHLAESIHEVKTDTDNGVGMLFVLTILKCSEIGIEE